MVAGRRAQGTGHDKHQRVRVAPDRDWQTVIIARDLAGADWPERARAAAAALLADGDAPETARVMLLADLRDLFTGEPTGILYTADILTALHARDDRPWPEYRGGRPITARQIAALLKPLGIAAETVRRGTGTMKGYRADDMADACYLPPDSSVTPVTGGGCCAAAAFGDFQSVTPDFDVTDRPAEELRISAGCEGVTDRADGAADFEVEFGERAAIREIEGGYPAPRPSGWRARRWRPETGRPMSDSPRRCLGFRAS